jgi:uncharacterized protein YqhQ
MAESDKLLLAGMALRNGVLMIGPTYWAAAVRNRAGEIDVISKERLQAPARFKEIPGLRGPIRLAEMLVVLPQMRAALPSARLPFESKSVLFPMLAGGAAGRILRGSRKNSTLRELASSVVAITINLAALRSSELAKYHGAEHKAIGGYEQGIEAADASKEHPRCGTHLAGPMIVGSTVATAVTQTLLPRAPGTARLLGSLGGIALATEFARSAQRTPLNERSGLAGLAARVGTSLQSIASTREPDADQLEVAEAALDALLRAEPVTS